MKNKYYLMLIITICSFNFSISQVGIGTAAPDSQLDIRSSNVALPTNTDGILIPRVSTLTPNGSMTAAQQGMLVYLTATYSGNLPGFYYWDNSVPSWIGITSTANGDKDWFKVGTTSAPSAITDDMFHTGNVAIGKNTADYPLDILTTNNVNGIYNELSNNNNAGSKVGIVNRVSDTTTDSKIGLRNDVTSNGNSLLTVGISNLVGSVGAQLYGTSNTLSGSNGTQSNLDGTRNTISVLTGANNNVNGVYNILTPSTTGFFNGVNNLVTSSNGGLVNGVLNQFSGSTTAENNGVYSSINVTGGADVNGVTNLITGTGNVFGLKNSITGSGASINKGQYSNLSGTTTGDQYGSHNIISSQGNISSSRHYGIYNTLSGNALNKYGTYSTLSGTGTIYGNYVDINNATGQLYGGYTTIAGSFGTNRYGQKIILNNGGATGETWGDSFDITSSSSSPSYGSEITLNGTGNGTKYGNKLLINPAVGGTHYGIYSEVLGSTNFAGYFLGNVGIGTTTANTYKLPPSRGTVGQVMRTDGSGNVNWANNSDFAWSLTGNAVTASDFIGTTNSQPFRVFCNNIERIRINPTDGEIITGALASPYVGDLLNGVSTATLPFAVNGYSSQNGSGTWGEILAASTTAFSAVQGVYGGSGVGAGVLGNYNGTGTSTTRAGVSGVCSTPSTTNGGVGVSGYNSIASGNQRVGVLGQYNGTAFGMGVVGIGFGGGIMTGNNDVAVVGWRANNQNYSGYFNGNHVIANGTKSASVGTSKGNQLLYVTEAPEVWFEDLGGGQLVNGSTHISLDEMYLETIFVDNTHPMRIFLQEEGESNGLIVIKDADNKGFTVKEKNNGTSNISFSYRIMAKRLHFQNHRFGNDPVWGGGDTRKYNQYATPPPVDYNENVRFQAEQKKNYKPTPMPEGFIDYMTLQKQAQQLETKKTEKKQ